LDADSHLYVGLEFGDDLLSSSEVSMTASSGTFDPSQYPRFYRLAQPWRSFLLVLSAFVLAAGSAGIWWFGTGRDPHAQGAGAAAFMSLLCIAVMLLGGYSIADTLRLTVILHADAIEMVRPLRARRLRRDEIRGFRRGRSTDGAALILVRDQQVRGALRIPLTIRQDSAFRLWFSGIADLDAAKRQQQLSAALANPLFGRTLAARLGYLRRQFILAVAIGIATALVCAWAFFFPRPYALAVSTLAFLPLVLFGMVALFGDPFPLDAQRDEPSGGVGALLALPGIVLGLRAMLDIQFIGWQRPLMLVAGGTLAVIALVLLVSRRLRSLKFVLVLAPVVAPYVYGAVMEADVLLDRSPAKISYGIVTGKDLHIGKPRPYRSLRLDPLGPYTLLDQADVSADVFRSVAVGDTVCIWLRSGFLAIPWYAVGRCH
jgi:hypothetical protein